MQSSSSSMTSFIRPTVVTNSTWAATQQTRRSISHRRIARYQCSAAPRQHTATVTKTTAIPVNQSPRSHTQQRTTLHKVRPSVQSKPVPWLDGWRYTGPCLETGPATPVVVYFALTATQSLEVAPINDVVTKMHGVTSDVRIFSPTLPYHSDTDMAANERVFHTWVDTYMTGGDIISLFTRHVNDAINTIVQKPFTDRSCGIHVVGLSRGALFAGLVSARNQHIKSFTAFAPVVTLMSLSEFESSEGISCNERILGKIKSMSLNSQEVVDQIVANGVDVRCYMGNIDVRVGTKPAFDFSYSLAVAANKQGVRSPPHEFIMYPSVGKHGHGTPPHVFAAGSKYILSQIEAKTLSTASKN